MAASELEGLYDRVNDALQRRVQSLGEDPSQRDLATLLTQIRALKLVAQQLPGTSAEHEATLIDALQGLTGELA